MFNYPKYPPFNDWDQRLTNPKLNLEPVELLLKTPYFSVLNRGGYFTVEPTSIPVVILPIVNQDSIVFVRAKRPVISDFSLELPSGGLMSDENPRYGALRELFEETGVKVDDADRLQVLPPKANSPNRNPYLIYCFGIDLSEAEWNQRLPHDEEIYSVERLLIPEIIRMIRDGEIYVALHVALASSYILTNFKITR
jgi:8-oxo-dGTP pyrophosphatase MutT (NUDIX family)